MPRFGAPTGFVAVTQLALVVLAGASAGSVRAAAHAKGPIEFKASIFCPGGTTHAATAVRASGRISPIPDSRFKVEIQWLEPGYSPFVRPLKVNANGTYDASFMLQPVSNDTVRPYLLGAQVYVLPKHGSAAQFGIGMSRTCTWHGTF